MNERDCKVLRERLIPIPKKLQFHDGAEYLLRDQCRVVIAVPEEAAAEKARELFRKYWGVQPRFVPEKTVPSFSCDEAYEIRVTETELFIAAPGVTGVMNACKTLRQLAEVCRGTEKVEGYFLVPCTISDEPAMPFRGIHLCIFPETPLWDIEKQLRLAAYYKFNYAVIEPWGVFPFESHPEFCWADRKLDRAELKRLIRLGKELGITLVPQLNLLGHAAASRADSGKHAVLDYAPALQPLFEPEGWSWCISNPEARRIQSDLVTELHEFFDSPPFFHIGCDEAYDVGTCHECRRHLLKDLIRDHIVYFHDLFQKRGAKVIMWHDMLIARYDKRWKGYVANGRMLEHHLRELSSAIPHDIIIADWQYGYNKKNEEDPEPEWPTVRFFKNEKFDVVVCPWADENHFGTESLGKLAAQEQLMGMLVTTWHTCHGGRVARMFTSGACASWNPADFQCRGLVAAHHMRQIGWDMGIAEYEKTGWSQKQVDAGEHLHR